MIVITLKTQIMTTVAHTIYGLVNGALKIEKDDGVVYQSIKRTTRTLDLEKARTWERELKIGIAHLYFLEELSPHQKQCALKAVADLLGPCFCADTLIYRETRGKTLRVKIKLHKSVTVSDETWSHFCTTKDVARTGGCAAIVNRQ